MAYVVTSQLQARLGSTLYARLTDRVAGSAANASVAQELIDQASAIADSHLSVRYATPVNLADRPELASIMVARVLDLTEGLAWRGSPWVNDVPDRVRLIVREAEEWFRAVAAGQAALPGSAEPASPTAMNDGPRFSGGEKTLTPEELEGW